MRTAALERKTSETQIKVALNLDGSGKSTVKTPIGIFNHFLSLFCFFSKIDLEVYASGDLEVDEHHLMEDTGIVLGQAIKGALGEKRGIARFGWSAVPMDEALVLVSLDLSGRSHLNYDLSVPEWVGKVKGESFKEFFLGFVRGGELTLHIKGLSGENGHHIMESAFKGLGMCLKSAKALVDDRIPSTKGVI
ncbi:Imidazoleglycerol-phosphate dehydratase [Fervidicola ferrireducens]|uniref:Imidazoleglycerol-phosphate dehydratase n=1 Tax=Fervidicola ferrireducens TaxID=520764 RepID=A0A140L558_9FIRM|nr:imidazoleglycerol-phosphate dehydratase HisB [Fervidicola ferrireducens]KXG75683.1 Imidazoleglycerol-phosphate dehydratase [Fervidicola ferrireducens]